MTGFRRYSVFVIPEGDLYRAGTNWLGWDCVARQQVRQPEVCGLDQPISQITATPRRYGFHGTIRPPFHPAPSVSRSDLRIALKTICSDLAPVTIPRLRVSRLGSFVAIVPQSPSAALGSLAAAVVKSLDPLRKPLTEEDIARHRTPGLSARQVQMLADWGYPFVLDDFRFHLTLTGRLGGLATSVAARAAAHFDPLLSRPFHISTLCLMGEAENGNFEMLDRLKLEG